MEIERRKKEGRRTIESYLSLHLALHLFEAVLDAFVLFLQDSHEEVLICGRVEPGAEVCDHVFCLLFDAQHVLLKSVEGWDGGLLGEGERERERQSVCVCVCARRNKS